MEYSDPYDPRVAFDDMFDGGDVSLPHGNVAMVIERVYELRLPATPRRMKRAKDTTAWSFALPDKDSVIGADFPATPLYEAFHNRYRVGIPAAKLVRLDSEGTYKTFRASRREPYIERVSHIVSGCGDDVDVGVYDDVIMPKMMEAAQGGTFIPLPVPGSGDAIEAWQDGNEILCTIRFMTKKGPRRLTTATPAQRHVDEVIGCALEVGCEHAVSPELIQMLGASHALSEACRAAMVIGDKRPPYVGAMMPESDPQVAAMMEMVQRSQASPRARQELSYILSSRAGRKMANQAMENLQRRRWS